ncbi:ERF family protein [Amycolatopsis kentuckyensis]|uniref:ERF family protein n=1 Tax=Amycolatopsis kentuckyensis TaxID=218823 RepID=UPI00356648A7
MTDTKSVYEALNDVMADVRAVGKGDYNKQQGFSFRGIDAVVNAVGPVLRRHRVIVAPLHTEARYRDVLSAKQTPMRECTVLVTYRIYGPAGDHIDTQVAGEAMDIGDKGTPKAMSVAYRTALLQALCLPTNEPDPDHDTYERGDQGKPDTLLDQIRNYATEQGFDLYAVMADFQARTGEEIQAAPEEFLRAYLDDLKRNGLRQEEAAE